MRTTSCYGSRSYVYQGRWVSDFHRGIDLAAGTGTPIRAMASGTVTKTGRVYSGYGISTVIAHAGSRWSHYAHQSRTIVVPGQRVVVGQVIGYSGATGQVTAPHLHIEIATGAYVIGSQINPAPFLRSHGVNVGGC
jgi:murein DD-endopeptidase MepM/ murein hydrolase activator NlpD